MKNKTSKKRNVAVVVIITLVFAAFLVKLWDIQVVSAGEAKQAAVKGTEVSVEPVRGEILDRDGNTLATSKQVRTIVFNYYSFPGSSESEKRNKIIFELISLFDRNGAEWVDELPIKVSRSGKLYFAKEKENEVSYLRSSAFLDLNPYATVQNCFDALVKKYSLESYSVADARKIASVYYSMVKDGFNSTTPYVFAKDVSAALASDIKEKSDEFTGVDVQLKSVREYPDGTIAPHLLGLVGAISAEEYEAKKSEGYALNDTIGKNGIEYTYESELRGTAGKKLITTDSNGNTTEKYITLPKNGNSVVLVDHDTEILSKSDWIIEMGEKAGAEGGYVISQGTVEEVEKDKRSLIGKFLSGEEKVLVNEPVSKDKMFELGKIILETSPIHTVKSLKVEIPKGKLSVVTGVSGSGKTTMVLESLVPALDSLTGEKKLPEHVKMIDAEGIKSVKLIDATPIGINVRSTVATYANIHDELRKFFAKLDLAKEKGYKAGDFSYNTGKLRCPVCDGTGQISLDVQFLPDVDIPCPECNGSRYSKEAYSIKYNGYSLPEIMSMDVNTALGVLGDLRVVRQRLEVLKELGLGYLTLGEATPSLSGGEAQRLKLASEMRKAQTDTVFVFDEPTIGLHPLDVRTLLGVFKTLVDNGATVVVIEHDLDVIRNADWVIDMGPEGGDKGGEIVFSGTVEDLKKCKKSKTAKFV